MVVLTLLLLCLIAPAQSAIIRVSPNGDDNNDGSSWALAKKTLTRNDTTPVVLKGALTAAVSGDEIWVAAGTYVERISLKDGVTLYGGFAGTEATREQRDSIKNVTTLDGGQAGTVVTAASGVGTVNPTIIDGFTIQGGKAANGGGVSLTGCVVQVTNNRIIGNSATSGGGGGVYIAYCLTNIPSLSGNFIANNSAPSGAGVYMTASSPDLASNVIAGNVASGNGGGITSMSNSSPTIRSCRIVGNTASSGGGGIYLYQSAAKVRSTSITGNVATANGGGIYCVNCAPTIINATVAGNKGSAGGGVYLSSSPLTIANTIVAFNSSGIYKSGSDNPIVKFNCVYNPAGANYTGISAGAGSISDDPKFAAADYGNFHIQPDSPCINTGDNASIPVGMDNDIDGEARIQTVTVDMGADETNGVTWSPTIIRVSPSGDDSNDGSTWMLAKKTIQNALDTASEQGGEIWVKGGTYNENIYIWPYTTLYGGFDDTDTQRSDRNWTINPTILDGGQSGSVVTIRSGNTSSGIDGFAIRNGSGGGINCTYSLVSICNNTISGNTTVNGGGIYCLQSTASVVGNVIEGNIATNGGGIYCFSSPASIFNNTIKNNTAVSGTSGQGGGIYCNQSSASIVDNVIVGNNSISGGGVYCTGASTPTITNNTIVDNTVPTGTGFGGGLRFESVAASAINNIVAFNSSGLSRNTSGSVTLKNNCVYGNTDYDYSGVSAGSGSISLDPMFVDLTGQDFHIRTGSPCIDAGLDSAAQSSWLDMDGRPRFYGPHVDMGAYEAYVTAQPTFSPDGGIFKSAQEVTVSCATDGAVIHYTTDGTDPDESDPIVASGSTVTIDSPCTLKARAYLPDYNQSAIKSAEFVITGDMNIASVKGSEDHESVGLFDAVVSAAFTDFFYIEDENRIFGIRVDKPGHGLTAGMKAAIVGIVDTNDDGERFIDATIARQNGTDSLVKPIAFVNKTLGGADRIINGKLEQEGVEQGFGLNSIGLLVKTTGKVVQLIDATSFYLDDGSGVSLKVIGGTAAENSYVSVLGACSCERRASDAKLVRVVRVQKQADIKTLKAAP
jgi:parallel beta-helix repeat protein